MSMFTQDAQTASLNFVINQAYTVNTQAYANRFPELDFGRLVYVDTSAPEFTPGIVTFLGSSVGRAEWYSGAAKDVPRADVTRDKNEVKVHMAAVGYGYDSEEVGTAQLMNVNLTADKALAARRAYSEFMWQVALLGATDKNLAGLATQTGVTSGPVAANGTGSPNTLWFANDGTMTKTPAQIIADINGALTGIYTGSRTVEMADTILLPYVTLAQLASTPMSSTNSETILTFIKRTNIYTMTTGQELTIRGELGLETLGQGGTKLMVAYANRQDVARLHLPMPHRFFPVWQDGPMSYQIPGAFRTGGVEVIRPGAFRYLYGF